MDIEVLPIKLLTDEDAPLFGSLAVSLGKLSRIGLPVVTGIVITPPNLKLKTTLEHFDFKTKEVFTQSLTLVKKEINSLPVPEILKRELSKHKRFLFNELEYKSIKEIWLALLDSWLQQIKERLWNKGFYSGITEGLEPQSVIFFNKIESFGRSFFDPLKDDVEIVVKKGRLHPNDTKKIVDIVEEGNKKLLIPFEYEWILDKGVKLIGIKSYTPSAAVLSEATYLAKTAEYSSQSVQKSAVKIIFDLSNGFTIEKNIDGVYIASEKIFDLNEQVLSFGNKPKDSFEEVVFKVVESAITFSNVPLFFKLADKSEGMGKVRGSLRLLHQESLLNPLIEALDFARHKKGLLNVHVVIPFVRRVSELLQVKRELAIKKLMRKSSLQMWLEIAVLENIVNLEDYLIVGIDGVVLNLDELIAHLNGFDPLEGELAFYKNEVDGLIKFLEDGIRLLHKAKIPFIAYGNIVLNSKVLEFLVEKGVYGVVVDRYEAHSAHELLHQTEKRIILRKVT